MGNGGVELIVTNSMDKQIDHIVLLIASIVQES